VDVIVGRCLLGTDGRRVRATAPEDGFAHAEQALDVVAAVVVVVVVVSAVQWLEEDHRRMQNIIGEGVVVVAAVGVVLESTGGLVGGLSPR
jgi:branched-subunit amino acid permease